MRTSLRALTAFALLSFLCTCGPAPTDVADAEIISKEVSGGTETATSVKLNYLELDLPVRHYLVLRQELALADVNGFIGMESEALTSAAARAGVVATGPLTMLTYEWDTGRKWADLAVALPVSADTKMPPYVNIALPATKALALDVAGSYDALSAMHVALSNELNRRGHEATLPAIEEYPVGPMQVSDPHEFETRLIYPYATLQQ